RLDEALETILFDSSVVFKPANVVTTDNGALFQVFSIRAYQESETLFQQIAFHPEQLINGETLQNSFKESLESKQEHLVDSVATYIPIQRNGYQGRTSLFQAKPHGIDVTFSAEEVDVDISEDSIILPVFNKRYRYYCYIDIPSSEGGGNHLNDLTYIVWQPFDSELVCVNGNESVPSEDESGIRADGVSMQRVSFTWDELGFGGVLGVIYRGPYQLILDERIGRVIERELDSVPLQIIAFHCYDLTDQAKDHEHKGNEHDPSQDTIDYRKRRRDQRLDGYKSQIALDDEKIDELMEKFSRCDTDVKDESFNLFPDYYGSLSKEYRVDGQGVEMVSFSDYLPPLINLYLTLLKEIQHKRDRGEVSSRALNVLQNMGLDYQSMDRFMRRPDVVWYLTVKEEKSLLGTILKPVKMTNDRNNAVNGTSSLVAFLAAHRHPDQAEEMVEWINNMSPVQHYYALTLMAQGYPIALLKKADLILDQEVTDTQQIGPALLLHDNPKEKEMVAVTYEDVHKPTNKLSTTFKTLSEAIKFKEYEKDMRNWFKSEIGFIPSLSTMGVIQKQVNQRKCWDEARDLVQDLSPSTKIDTLQSKLLEKVRFHRHASLIREVITNLRSRAAVMWLDKHLQLNDELATKGSLLFIWLNALISGTGHRWDTIVQSVDQDPSEAPSKFGGVMDEQQLQQFITSLPHMDRDQSQSNGDVGNVQVDESALPTWKSESRTAAFNQNVDSITADIVEIRAWIGTQNKTKEISEEACSRMLAVVKKVENELVSWCAARIVWLAVCEEMKKEADRDDAPGEVLALVRQLTSPPDQWGRIAAAFDSWKSQRFRDDESRQ
ncbi:MAG: hypothetical protein HQL50_12480, partial [Magnetococcales bacterium]|nr:hypothetical protein [Magnetococcales bacterium]